MDDDDFYDDDDYVFGDDQLGVDAEEMRHIDEMEEIPPRDVEPQLEEKNGIEDRLQMDALDQSEDLLGNPCGDAFLREPGTTQWFQKGIALFDLADKTKKGVSGQPAGRPIEQKRQQFQGLCQTMRKVLIKQKEIAKMLKQEQPEEIFNDPYLGPYTQSLPRPDRLNSMLFTIAYLFIHMSPEPREPGKVLHSLVDKINELIRIANKPVKVSSEDVVRYIRLVRDIQQRDRLQ